MKNTMEYKGYVGSVEFSERDGILYGKVLGIRSLISYEGTSVLELVEDFHGSVDYYLSVCAEEGTEPEVAYKGSFNVRIGSDLHKRAAIYALEHQQTLNAFIAEAVDEKLSAEQALENADTFRPSDKREITIDDAKAIMGYINGDYILPIKEF